MGKYEFYAWHAEDGSFGIHESYDECKAAFAGKPNKKDKGFKTREAAEAFIEDGLNAGKAIQHDTIKSLMDISTGEKEVILKCDLPDEIIKGILEYFNVNSLTEISSIEISSMKSCRDIYETNKIVEYNKACVDYYTLNYLSANFYKIWHPLYKLISINKLPREIKILEIGNGPGTATWGLISFYEYLAFENPIIDFRIEYDCVELETNFGEIFFRLRAKCLENLPRNLEVNFKKVLYGIDAFNYLGSLKKEEYDIILESNLVNYFENLEADNKKIIDSYVNAVNNGLKPKGHVIFIEPGENKQKYELEVLGSALKDKANCSDVIKPSISNVNTDKLSIYHEAVNIGLRTCAKDKHWFSCMLLQKK